MSAPEEGRVLIIAPVGQDGEAMAAMLTAQDIRSEICTEPRECLREMATGAGALLLTEEVLEMAGVDELFADLKSQPEWSELPVIFLTSGGESRLASLQQLAASAAATVLLLERPMSPATLLGSVQAALRTRQRQYLVRDLMTEQERQRREIRESERQFRALADTIPNLAWQANGDGYITWYNRQWYEYTGTTPEQMAGWGWQSVHDPEMLPRVLERWRGAIADSEPFEMEFPLRGADGRYRWFLTRVVPVKDAEGRVARWFGTNTDVTTRKTFEEELERLVAERTAKLQELVGELEHFSYSITHDMRAPLRAMMAFGQMLEELCADSPNPEQKDFARRIGVAAKRMDLLITDALNYSTAVRSEMPLAPVDVGRLLRGMVDTYPELQNARRGIRVEPDLPLVMGNVAGLTQCFSNLLENAVKFAQPGKTPEIQVRAQVLDRGRQADGQLAKCGGEWVRIWVEDKGIGISKTMLPRIFDMFARGASRQAGTGIGLALVRKVVSRMGGRVGVESEEGKGSRFWLDLKPGNVRQRADWHDG